MATVSSDAMTTFNDWKIHSKKGEYLVFRLGPKGEINAVRGMVELPDGTDLSSSTHWPILVNTLDDDEPCWCAVHFRYTTSGGDRVKTVLIQWIPSSATMKNKMQYAMWSNMLKSCLVGVHCMVPAGNKLTDLEIRAVQERITRFEKETVIYWILLRCIRKCIE